VGTLVFVAVALLSAAIFVLAPGRLTTASAPFLPQQDGAIPWNGHDRLTILVIVGHGGGQADALTIASYNPRNSSLRLLSLPANLWVTIPDSGQARLEDIYPAGGASMSLLVAQSVTHVLIPYYAYIDEHVLAHLVDTLGGLAVSPSEARRAPSLHLNGRTTLAYAFGPQSTGNHEITRMRRSQTVLLALMRAALQPSQLFQIPTIVNTMGGDIPTNLPYAQIPALARAFVNVRASRVRRDQLSFANNSVTDFATGGEHVLLPDWQNIRAVAQHEFGAVGIAPRTPITVLNGAGITGQAAGLAQWLRLSGIHVSGYSSAGSFSHNRTEVFIDARAPARVVDAARSVAALMQVPIVTGLEQQRVTGVRVIIGRDFRDPTQQ